MPTHFCIAIQLTGKEGRLVVVRKLIEIYINYEQKDQISPTQTLKNQRGQLTRRKTLAKSIGIQQQSTYPLRLPLPRPLP